MKVEIHHTLNLLYYYPFLVESDYDSRVIHHKREESPFVGSTLSTTLTLDQISLPYVVTLKQRFFPFC